MSNNETCLLTTQDQGPVKISPQARHDLTWLAQNELGELEGKFRHLKQVNRHNPFITGKLWSNFPTAYEASLIFIDERAGVDTTYAKAQKMVQEGTIASSNNTLMQAHGEIAEGIGKAKVQILTRPYYTNKSFRQFKWGQRETLRAAILSGHEFAHAIQGILAKVVAQSELDLNEVWASSWVEPMSLSEGYAMTHEGAIGLVLDEDEMVYKPLLYQAIRWNMDIKESSQITSEEMNKNLNSWLLKWLEVDRHSSVETWKNYNLAHFIYLSIIGLRLDVSPEYIMSEVQNTPELRIFKQDLYSLDIKEKTKLIKIPFPQFIIDEADKIEFEKQLFYYQDYSKLAWAGSEVSQQYKNKKKGMPKRVEVLNNGLFQYLLKKNTPEELLTYLNQVIKQVHSFAKNSPYSKRTELFAPHKYQATSVYSRSEENLYYPILQKKFYLDGISSKNN